MVNAKYVLASGSPRRRELLGMLNVDFRVDTSRSVDEIVPDGTPAHEVPLFLSRIKAEPYLSDLQPDEVLITADTVVILDDEVIGKPKDLDDARAILRRLSGRTHRVVTGVSIGRPGRPLETFSETTEVIFDPLTEREIDYYVENFKPLDKAGAYGIQEWIGAAAVKGLNGSYYNVMGLPVHALYKHLNSVNK
ncbi:MAG: Maf family nucleotide pyrophosphatase [Muribaculaceae bacterium]|nr:Maf family nucleotide pyrophosphatase [Muribaculaceae bacterium]